MGFSCGHVQYLFRNLLLPGVVSVPDVSDHGPPNWAVFHSQLFSCAHSIEHWQAIIVFTR